MCIIVKGDGRFLKNSKIEKGEFFNGKERVIL